MKANGCESPSSTERGPVNAVPLGPSGGGGGGCVRQAPVACTRRRRGEPEGGDEDVDGRDDQDEAGHDVVQQMQPVQREWERAEVSHAASCYPPPYLLTKLSPPPPRPCHEPAAQYK